MINNPLELYIHIPFCVKKCAYCDFLSAPGDEETMTAYTEALCQEILGREREWKDRNITSIFFGGGTPSVLPDGCIEKVMNVITENLLLAEDCEITLEMNPGTITWKKLLEYKRAGINRLSIGLQSADNEELKLLGRIHSFEEFEENYRLARDAGFENINVDLISAVPEQTRESFLQSLERVTGLEKPPCHISVYSLIVEEGTPFYSLYHNQPELFLTDEEDRALYHETREYLAKRGYERYEISNYARKGCACRHNIGYWKRTDYLGFGIGAASLLGGCRFSNKEDLMTYLQSPLEARSEKEKLSVEDEMSEFAFLGLRMCQGISEKEFCDYFGRQIDEVFGTAIQKSIEEKLLSRQNGRLYLTEYGLDVSNYVMSRFLL